MNVSSNTQTPATTTPSLQQGVRTGGSSGNSGYVDPSEILDRNQDLAGPGEDDDVHPCCPCWICKAMGLYFEFCINEYCCTCVQHLQVTRWNSDDDFPTKWYDCRHGCGRDPTECRALHIECLQQEYNKIGLQYDERFFSRRYTL